MKIEILTAEYIIYLCTPLAIDVHLSSLGIMFKKVADQVHGLKFIVSEDPEVEDEFKLISLGAVEYLFQ